MLFLVFILFHISLVQALSSLPPTVRAPRHGHSDASEHVGLGSQWLQETIVDKKLTLEKVHIAVHPADVWTKAFVGGKIRELRRLAFVSCVTVNTPWLSVLRTGLCLGWTTAVPQPHEVESDGTC